MQDTITLDGPGVHSPFHGVSISAMYLVGCPSIVLLNAKFIARQGVPHEMRDAVVYAEDIPGDTMLTNCKTRDSYPIPAGAVVENVKVEHLGSKSGRDVEILMATMYYTCMQEEGFRSHIICELP